MHYSNDYIHRTAQAEAARYLAASEFKKREANKMIIRLALWSMAIPSLYIAITNLA